MLCGGKGTRAYPHTLELPKPLLDVAGQPILRHVLDIFARQGVRHFILAAGYKIAMIREFATTLPDDWEVKVLDTGEDANTGSRILQCRHLLRERFLATYGDGVGDIDLPALVRFHEASGGTATITTVPLPSQFGTVDTDGAGRVLEFKEKPRLFDHWINGGFFVFEPTVFATWAGDDLEKDVLPALASAGQLHAYRHLGFWKSMDTYKDAIDLTDLAKSGRPPWLREHANPN
ncbi:MAG TPA: sugar phosphate nucleotidyltransferase [Acidimicrobiales bacterium]